MTAPRLRPEPLAAAQAIGLSKDQVKRLVANHEGMRREWAGGPTFDPDPVCKLTVAGTRACWLLASIAPWGEAYGVCDLGLGCPELWFVTLTELAEKGARPDRSFDAKMTVADYARMASVSRRIVV